MNDKYQWILKYKEYKCEICGISSWQNKSISLEVHHIDNNHNNDEISNLQLLCPNCHSQTDSYCKNNSQKQKISDQDIINALNKCDTIHQAIKSLKLSPSGAVYKRFRNIINQNNITKFDKQLKVNYCIDCGKMITLESKRCKECAAKQQQIIFISRDDLKNKIRKESFVNIGKEFNVSDNAIRKWCKKYNLPHTKKTINLISDEDWKLI